MFFFFFFFSSRRRHTRSLCDWSSDVCSSDLTWNTKKAFDAFIDLVWLEKSKKYIPFSVAHSFDTLFTLVESDYLNLPPVDSTCAYNNQAHRRSRSSDSVLNNNNKSSLSIRTHIYMYRMSSASQMIGTILHCWLHKDIMKDNKVVHKILEKLARIWHDCNNFKTHGMTIFKPNTIYHSSGPDQKMVRVSKFSNFGIFICPFNDNTLLVVCSH